MELLANGGCQSVPQAVARPGLFHLLQLPPGDRIRLGGIVKEWIGRLGTRSVEGVGPRIVLVGSERQGSQQPPYYSCEPLCPGGVKCVVASDAIRIGASRSKGGNAVLKRPQPVAVTDGVDELVVLSIREAAEPATDRPELLLGPAHQVEFEHQACQGPLEGNAATRGKAEEGRCQRVLLGLAHCGDLAPVPPILGSHHPLGSVAGRERKHPAKSPDPLWGPVGKM